MIPIIDAFKSQTIYLKHYRIGDGRSFRCHPSAIVDRLKTETRFGQILI